MFGGWDMSRFITLSVALAVLIAVTVTALHVQKHMLVAAATPKPLPIKQVIAQCARSGGKHFHRYVRSWRELT